MFTIADSSNPAIPFEAWMQTATEKGYIFFIFVKNKNFRPDQTSVSTVLSLT
jgi:hypothetical protein